MADEVICADTQGEVSCAGNDLQHEVLGVTYTVCRLKECSHHRACSNVQVVLRILSSSKKHLSSYNTHVNNNLADIFKSVGSGMWWNKVMGLTLPIQSNTFTHNSTMLDTYPSVTSYSLQA